MTDFSTRIGIENSGIAPRIVVVEPWARDYTLFPGEQFVIIALGDVVTPWFNIVEWDDTTQVCCEDTVDVKVMQGDKELECGHQRQA